MQLTSEIDYTKFVNDVAEAVAEKLKTKEKLRKGYLNYEQVRNRYFHSKNPAWVKYYILSQHPELFVENGGWLSRKGNQGNAIRLYDKDLAKADEWATRNDAKIDWKAADPITLKKHKEETK